MKIVIATPHYPPHHIGGTEQLSQRMALRLAERGHSVQLVCIESITAPAGQALCEVEVDNGVTVYRLHYNQAAAGDTRSWDFRNPLVQSWFAGFLAEQRPEIVHVFSGYLLSGSLIEAALDAGVKTVVTLLDFWFACPRITLLRSDGQLCAEPVPPARCAWCRLAEKRRYRLSDQALGGRLGEVFTRLAAQPGAAALLGAEPAVQLAAERRAYLQSVLARADAVVTHSHFLEEKIRQYGFDSRRWVYLPNGLPQAARRPAPAAAAAGVLRIGYLGQIAPHKGVEVLLDAYLEMDARPGQAELHIFGSLEQWPAYAQRLAQKAAGRPDIFLAGSFGAGEQARVLAGLDVVVVPSIWFENRPTVILEAFAHGKPVITSRLGGMTEMVRHGVDGLLFTPGDAHDLAGQLRSLLGPHSRLEELRAGIGPVQRFEDELAQLEELYARLLESQSEAVAA